MKEYHSHLIVATTHPSLAGHFPGKPIVPGVLILNAVLAASRQQTTNAIVELSRVKFQHPLLPEQRLNISIKMRDATSANFVCRLNSGQTVAAGRLSWSTDGTELSDV